MIEIFGEIYYIDFDIIDKFLSPDSQFKPRKIIEKQTTVTFDSKGNTISKMEVENETYKPTEINGVRFEIIRNFIEDISDPTNNTGASLAEMSIGFKLAFNTLTAYRILKPIED